MSREITLKKSAPVPGGMGAPGLTITVPDRMATALIREGMAVDAKDADKSKGEAKKAEKARKEKAAEGAGKAGKGKDKGKGKGDA